MIYIFSVHFSSISQLCLTLCDPMDCSTPGCPVNHQLLEPIKLMSIVSNCHPTISSSVIPFSSRLQSFPASGAFPVSRFFESGGQSIGVSASASLLAMNIQEWFPLGFIQDWFLVGSPCSPRDFQESSPIPQLRSINSLAFSLLYCPNFTSIHVYWKNHSFDYMGICW